MFNYLLPAASWEDQAILFEKPISPLIDSSLNRFFRREPPAGSGDLLGSPRGGHQCGDRSAGHRGCGGPVAGAPGLVAPRHQPGSHATSLDTQMAKVKVPETEAIHF